LDLTGKENAKTNMTVAHQASIDGIDVKIDGVIATSTHTHDTPRFTFHRPRFIFSLCSESKYFVLPPNYIDPTDTPTKTDALT
jgi:hypothetical protein